MAYVGKFIFGIAVGLTFCSAFFVYMVASKPQNYEDCLLLVVKHAQSDNSANIGKLACLAKFQETQVSVRD